MSDAKDIIAAVSGDKAGGDNIHSHGDIPVVQSLDEKSDESVPMDCKNSQHDHIESKNNLEQENDNGSSSIKQSSILHLFAEDRFGKDTAGVAFFEQIASETKVIETDIDVAPDKHKNDNSCTSVVFESDTQEIISAWIPCERTKRVLDSVISPLAEHNPVEKEMITKPTIIILEKIADPVKLMLDEISQLGSQRETITIANVPSDVEGLKKLVECGSYHAAFNITTTLLKSLSVGNTCIVPPSPDSLRIWFVRIALLVKLRKFSLAEAEIDTFGNLDNPDLYYEFYGDKFSGNKGCMVPFSLRLLFAEIPQYNGNYGVTLNKLYAIHHVISKMKKNIVNGKTEDGSGKGVSEDRRNKSLRLWNQRECRVLYSIMNCFFSQRDYVMAINVAQSLLEKDKIHAVELYSALGRIYLQLGDVKSAQECFNSAFSSSEKDSDLNLKYKEIINKALFAVALGEIDKAHDLYKEALAFQPMDPLLTNNLSVCLLYMGKLKESLSLLENAIHVNPKAYLHDSIMFNICTLYELESSYCAAKKHALLKSVASFADDSFNVSSLKISASAKN